MKKDNIKVKEIKTIIIKLQLKKELLENSLADLDKYELELEKEIDFFASPWTDIFRVGSSEIDFSFAA